MSIRFIAFSLLLATMISAVPSTSLAGPGDVIISSPSGDYRVA